MNIINININFITGFGIRSFAAYTKMSKEQEKTPRVVILR
jgi:hypothetical protein